MRTLTRAEVCRDMAYSTLRIKDEGLKIGGYFEPSDRIVIYGAGAIGRQLCDLLTSENRAVECLVDRGYAGESHGEVPVWKFDGEEVTSLLLDSNTVVVVTPTYDWQEIMETVPEEAKARFIPAFLLFAYAEKEIASGMMNAPMKALHKQILDMDISGISNIIVTQTPYNLLLCLLANPNWQNALFILGKPLPESLGNNLDELGIPYMHIKANDMYPGNQALLEVLRLLGFLVALEGTDIWGLDHTVHGKMLFGGNFKVVEDGDFNFDPVYCHQNSFDCEDHSNPQLLRFDCGRRYVVGGYDEAVKEIYLTRDDNIQRVMEKKAILFDMEEKWNEKSADERKKILKVFGVDEEVVAKLNDMKECYIFLTKPMADDGFMTREEQQQLFEKIIGKYEEKNVVIKPHPRDDTDYGQLFPGKVVLPANVPIEVLGMIGADIKAMIGFGTTAYAYGDRIGAEIHDYTMDGVRKYD